MVVFLRAVVMIVVLVGLPAAWVYYGPLPRGAQRVVDRVLSVAQSAIGWEQRVEAAGDLKSAPRFDFSSEAAPAYSPGIGAPAAPLAEVERNPAADPNQALSQQAEPLLARLRSLGAAEYTLEKWGNQGQLYRFCCAMPLAQSDDHTRQFEAVAENPLASIEQVVGEVASWQLAHRGGR